MRISVSSGVVAERVSREAHVIPATVFAVWVRNSGFSAPTRLLLRSDKVTSAAREHELQDKVVKAGWALDDVLSIREVQS